MPPSSVDDTNQNSTENALEPADDIFNPKIDEETLEQDGESPFSPADDVSDTIPLDHPQTDTGIDAHEAYDAGLTSATGSDAQSVNLPQSEVSALEPEDEDGEEANV